MSLRGIPWLLFAMVVAGLAVGVLIVKAISDSSSGSVDAASAPAPSSSPPQGAVAVEPSPFARRSLGPRLIRLYTGIGEQVELDWSVIAAADQIEGSASPAAESERAAAIGYTLQSFGAADDYRTALEARNGAPGYAPSVLRLAERYRSLDTGRVPRGRRPLSLPARGTVIAGFGQRLGVLHDGIDIDAATGTPVRAAAPGLVLSTGVHTIFGEYTCVLHRLAGEPAAERELTTCYGNQSRYEVSPGDTVAAGEKIGEVGCTGTCVRPHVHFQVKLGAGQTAPVTDPAPFLGQGPIGAGTPLEAR